MNVPSRYGLLRVVGWLLRILALVILIACIVGAIWISNNIPPPGSGINILVPIVIVVGIANFIGWWVRGSMLNLLDDVEQRTRANAQAIERVMRLTEVQVTSGGMTGSSTQPLPAMGDR